MKSINEDLMLNIDSLEKKGAELEQQLAGVLLAKEES
mgnify:CR=1 FL=1